MRTFLALTIVLCTVGGLYLLQGPVFFWPDRFDPSQGVALGGTSSQLLGAGLLVIGAVGVMAARQAARSPSRPATRRWQLRYFLLIVVALGLVSAAFTTGERGPNPDWRPPSGTPTPHR
ncbi:hypothetical protein [Aromatoleum sp.]|uniref:hypothetical protein n=1 Tax=Aromatoleum sp. TaxID=2307007 RepID=UPI002FCC2C7A